LTDKGRTRAVTAVALGLALLLVGAVAAEATRVARAKGGSDATIVGRIVFSGGPPKPVSKKPSLGGVVTVFDREGQPVTHQRVHAGHHFRFTLPPGEYKLNVGRVLHPRNDCGPKTVRLKAGRTAHVLLSVGCLVP
jgi:hypothetical protein